MKTKIMINNTIYESVEAFCRAYNVKRKDVHKSEWEKGLSIEQMCKKYAEKHEIVIK